MCVEWSREKILTSKTIKMPQGRITIRDRWAVWITASYIPVVAVSKASIFALRNIYNIIYAKLASVPKIVQKAHENKHLLALGLKNLCEIKLLR